MDSVYRTFISTTVHHFGGDRRGRWWRTAGENDDVVVELVWWEMGVVSER